MITSINMLNQSMINHQSKNGSQIPQPLIFQSRNRFKENEILRGVQTSALPLKVKVRKTKKNLIGNLLDHLELEGKKMH